MRRRIIISSIIFFLFAQFSYGQYFDTGQDPASLKWLQIRTSRFTVIFPESYGSEGAVFARSLDEAYTKLITLYPEKKFKIPVIIHNFTIQSNGYVAWAPRRMELYPTPEQNSIPLASEKQLAVHELTHVFQMESLFSGFSKAMSLFFGEQFTGIIASLLPRWFLEGDAVFAETVLTESGRGRSPAFQKQLKAIAVEQGNMYNYDKIIHDSYRNYIPDYYQSGYQMVTWSLAKYDPQIWNMVLNYTANQPFTINPVNLSLRRNAGLTKKKLFIETFDSLKTIWSKDISDINAIKYDAVNPSKNGQYISYFSPVIAGADSIIAIRTSMDDVPEFVLIDPARRSEQRIHIPGQMYPLVFSYAREKIVWVETEPDPRWDNREYSVIKILDLNNKLVKKLSHKSRYLSVSISPDGQQIAVSENTSDNINNLIFLDCRDGSVLNKVTAPGNVYLERLRWSDNGRKITVIFLTEAGEGIMSYTPANNTWEELVAAGRDDLQSTYLRNDSLFYVSSSSGTDNVYLKTPGNKITSLTNSGFGIIDLSVKGKEMIFSDYSSLGNNLCITNIDNNFVNRNEKVTSSSFLINRIKSAPKAEEDNPVKSYTPVPYRKWQHLFKFHSWMPFYADIEKVKADPTSVRPGISIMSQNNLSTLISSIGYEYSTRKEHVFHSRITWKGWYPVFESQLDYGNNPGISKPNTSIGNPSVIQTGMRFTNSVYIPLRFNSGRFSEYIMPSFTTEYQNDYLFIRGQETYDYGQTILSGRLYFTNYVRSAFRDIYPRWAQAIDLNYSFAPFDKSVYGNAITLKTAFFFPGFFPSHGIKIRIEKEKQVSDNYYFGNRVSLPRGYSDIFVKDIDFLSVDYVLPVAYPDYTVLSLLYLKRISAGMFYDYASGPGNSIYVDTGNGLAALTDISARESLKSFGIELLADFHLFRIPYMISGGVQSDWKSFNQKPAIELLFNIDLYGMTIGKR